ncbi:MAG: hypothetical protein ACRDNC_11155 [Gaiellaceae bacterium]
MRRYVSWVVFAAVGVVGLAATVDALVPREPAAGPKPLASRTIPEQSADARSSIPTCDRNQLEFNLEIIDGPVALLRHVRGERCRRHELPLQVRILPAAGQPEGEIFGPEGILGGTFSAGVEHRAAFRYRPTCAERGPFVALAVTGGFAARREIPTDEPCFPAVQRKVVALGAGRDAASFAVEAIEPSTHTFTGRVLLPRAARVTISIQTRGTTVTVLDEGRRRDCHRRGANDLCIYPYAALPEEPGEWLVSMRKTSPEPATVRFQIRFEAL